MRPGRYAALGLGLASLAACGSPPEPTAVRRGLRDDLAFILRTTDAAISGTDAAALPLERAMSLVEGQLGGGASAGLAAKAQHALTRRLDRADAEAGEGLESLATVLETEVFTDANHQGDGIYTIPASLVCDDGTGAIDAGCADTLASLQLRIVVSGDDDVLHFGLQLGPSHNQPLTLDLRHTELNLGVDLDETSQAIAELAPILGEAAPNLSVAGALHLGLEVLGDAHVGARFGIDRSIAVAFAEPGVALTADSAVRFGSAVADVFSIDLDGAAGRGQIAVALGSTTAHIPGDAADAGLDLDLPGVTTTVDLAAGQPVTFTRVGLGDRSTVLSRAGQPLITVDLNRDLGRRFDATYVIDPVSGVETVTVEPGFDLRISTDHAALGEPAPRFDVTQVSLQADGGAAPALAASTTSNGSEQVQVVSGQLVIATNPAEYGVTVAAGSCLASAEASDATGTWTQWSSITCE